MPKILIRLIALTLVPAILAQSIYAQRNAQWAMSNAESRAALRRYALPVAHGALQLSSFGSQALAASPAWMRVAFKNTQAFFFRRSARDWLETGAAGGIASLMWLGPLYARWSEATLAQHPGAFFVLMMPVGFVAALVGGFLEQYFRIHILEKAKQLSYRWVTTRGLIWMGLFYSSGFESFIFGPCMNKLGQWVPFLLLIALDVLLISALIVDTMAVYFYEHWAEGKTHEEAEKVIATQMQIVYPVLAVVWLPFSVTVNLLHGHVQRFMVASAGIILWNIAFAWLEHERKKYEAGNPSAIYLRLADRAPRLMRLYQWAFFSRQWYLAAIPVMIGVFFTLIVGYQVYSIRPYDLSNPGIYPVAAILSYVMMKIDLNGRKDLSRYGLKMARTVAAWALVAIMAGHPNAGPGLIILSAFAIAKGPGIVSRYIRATLFQSVTRFAIRSVLAASRRALHELKPVLRAGMLVLFAPITLFAVDRLAAAHGFRMFGAIGLIFAGVTQMDDWVPRTWHRIQNAALEWRKRKSMPHPEIFWDLFRNLAKDVATSISDSRRAGEIPKRDQIRRRDSLIVFGELLDALRNPQKSRNIWLLPAEKMDAKHNEKFILIRSSIGRFVVHAHFRSKRNNPRIRWSLWRDGFSTKREAALYQYRLDTYKNSIFLDIVRANKPTTAKKAWQVHNELAAWRHAWGSKKGALKKFHKWVEDTRHRLELLPKYEGRPWSHPIISWRTGRSA